MAVSVLGLSTMGFIAVALSTDALQEENEASADAVGVAREALERMAASSLSDVFAEYNAEGADDPGGPSTATGATWDVARRSRSGVWDAADPDEVGEAVVDPITCRVRFPTVEQDGVTVLREDLDLPEFGLPRDLNGDGVVDSDSRNDDYELLPVALDVDYPSATGVRRITVVTVLRASS